MASLNKTEEFKGLESDLERAFSDNEKGENKREKSYSRNLNFDQYCTDKITNLDISLRI